MKKDTRVCIEGDKPRELTHCPEHGCKLDARGNCPGCALGLDDDEAADLYAIVHADCGDK